jgi:hypothetical protein
MNISSVISRYISYIPRLLSLLHLLLPFLSIYICLYLYPIPSVTSFQLHWYKNTLLIAKILAIKMPVRHLYLP